MKSTQERVRPKTKLSSLEVESWICPEDQTEEIDIDPDVFYDFFFSLPSIEAKNSFSKLKNTYLDKIEDANLDEEFENLDQDKRDGLQDDQYNCWEYRDLTVKIAAKNLNNERITEEEKEDWLKAAQEATKQLRLSIANKFSLHRLLDAIFLKSTYALLINFVVIYLIFTVMNTISSSGLPGRQRRDDVTSFAVILKADRSLTATDRFNNPEGITDVCQGLGWWMQDDTIFASNTLNMPTGKELRDTTKEHWDPYLNPDYICPGIHDTLENELLGYNHKPKCSSMLIPNVDPESTTWGGDNESPSYFLFQDQRNTEVYNKQGRVLTLKESGVSKEFTSMTGNYNGKVQQLQPLEPFQPRGSAVDGITMLPFWVALDRIWPSEWAVQALFSLDWNSRKGWNENEVVGGFNEFGRRPTAIVKANGYERYGEMIEEAMWQYLERSCWHKHEPVSKAKATYSKTNKYDLNADKVLKWENLDQGVRDWWRALGLGVDRSSCQSANTRVNTTAKCLSSGTAGCKRVNYHTARRWNSHNDDTIAKKNFDARDFSSIFFVYSCDTREEGNSSNLLITPIVGAPKKERLTWDMIDAGQADDGKLLEAATNLGYDEDEWDKHSSNPTSPPPDNLVLFLENYLEGEAYVGTFFWVQVICSMIMIAVSLIEIRNIFLWWHLTKAPRPAEKNWYMNVWKTVTTNSFQMRFWSSFLAFTSYIIIPVLTVEVSLLLILESQSALEVIKDTIALLFLLEINNYLQIRNAPESSKWKAHVRVGRATLLERHKNAFTLTLFLIFACLACVTIVMVYTGAVQSGFTSNFHPSIIFNPLRLRDFHVQEEAWGLFIVLVFTVVFSMALSEALVIGAEYIQKNIVEKYIKSTKFYKDTMQWLQKSFVPEGEMDVEVNDPVIISNYTPAPAESGREPGPDPDPGPILDEEPGVLRGQWLLRNVNGVQMDELVTDKTANKESRIIAQRAPPGLKQGYVVHYNQDGTPMFGSTSPGIVPMPPASLFMPQAASAGRAPSVNGSVQFSNMPSVAPFPGSAPPETFPA